MIVLFIGVIILVFVIFGGMVLMFSKADDIHSKKKNEHRLRIMEEEKENQNYINNG